MNALQAILLGLLQGLTEFIPVSSSGHLVLAQHFFGSEAGSDISFEVFLHLGTLLAVLLFFYKQIFSLIVSMFSYGKNIQAESHRQNRNMVLYLVLATFATGVFYMVFEPILKGAYDKPMVVAMMLLVTGALVFASDFMKTSSIPASNVGVGKSLLIGLAQGIAIMPGISRSGTTIAASLFCGMKRKDAAHFSFLLSIPAILAANVSEFEAIMNLDKAMLINYFLGFLAAFGSGYLVIAFLIRMIQKGSLKYFAFYCWLIAIVSIAWMVFSQ